MIVNENVLKNDERVALPLRELYRAYGYTQYKMSKFEEYDLYAKNKDFLVSDNVITFTDTNGKLMALKPDVTLSIVKNSKDDGGLHKVYYDENVYRISGSSRSYREIMQTGLECIGDVDDYAIAEVLMLAAKSLALISEDYVLDISHLGIVSDVLDGITSDADTRAALLVALGEKNLPAIRALAADSELLCSLVALQGAPEKVLPALLSLPLSDKAKGAVKVLSTVVGALESCKCAARVRIDFSVVNDVNYYNGIVFKGFVNGAPAGVLSGGQYDRLMRKMGRRSGAIGFAVYLDLLERLCERSSDFDVDTVLLYGEQDALGAVLGTVQRMTANGESVVACKETPKDVRYKRLVKWMESGVEILEENA